MGSKIVCGFCSCRKRKNVKNWFIFRGHECCLSCKVFIQGTLGAAYLQYRSDQIMLHNAIRTEVATPDQWMELRNAE